MPKQQQKTGENKVAGSFKAPVGISKVKATPTKKEAPVKLPVIASKGNNKQRKPKNEKNYPEEESSEYSFPDSNSQEHSFDGSVESSTDLSSSTTGSHDSSADSKKRARNHEVITLDPVTQKALEEKIEAQKTNIMQLSHQDKTSRVIYLGNIPEGFVDVVMKRFFGQFGSVTRVLVPKTRGGKLRGYAYIEFMDPAVAQIVADTMNGYIMFRRILKCEVVPPEKTGGCFVAPVVPKKKLRPGHEQIQAGVQLKIASLSGRMPLSSLNLQEQKYVGQYLRKEAAMRIRCEKLKVPYSYKPMQYAPNNY